MWCSTVGCIVTLTLSLLAAPLITEAQQASTMWRIAFLVHIHRTSLGI